MVARVRRDRLEVQHDREPEPPVADVVAPVGSYEIPYVEPVEYGLRVGWETEAVRLEAADFLMPTQVQQSSRRRLARVMARMREQARLDP
jgi:hypothetical protein